MAETDMSARLVDDKKRRVTFEVAVRLRKIVIVVSWISGLIFLVLGLLSLIIGQIKPNSSVLAFGLDALLSAMCSAVIIWRYNGGAKNIYSVRRESQANITLGILFIGFTVTIAIKAIISLVLHHQFQHVDVIFYLGLTDGIANLAFVGIKTYLAYQLQSAALECDATKAFMSTIAAGTMAVHIKLSHTKLWLMDPILGLIRAMIAFYGIWTIVTSLKILKEEEKRYKEEYCVKVCGQTPPTQEPVESDKNQNFFLW